MQITKLFIPLFVGLFFSICTMGQAPLKLEAMTLEQYIEIKKIQFKDLDKDTYVKSPGGLVADRFEMKPPYVFNFSDGAERRIYMFKISDSKTKSDISLLAVYKNIKSGKTMNVCIPSATADKKVWGLYIDDLKEVDKMDVGLSSCLSFVLSRELATSMAAAGGGDSTKASIEDDYEFCFPENSLVTLKNGNKVLIASVAKGDCIESANSNLQNKVFTKIKKVVVHENGPFSITKITLIQTSNITASLQGSLSSYYEMEATPNHPVFTEKGIKKIKELVKGDILYHYDTLNNIFVPVKVVELFPNFKTVDKVYNLITRGSNYLVNNLIVMKK